MEEGVFTTARLEDGALLLWEHHAKRLVENGRAVGLEIPLLDRDYFRAFIEEKGATKGVWRFRVTVTKEGITPHVEPYKAPAYPIELVPEQATILGPQAQIKSLSNLPRPPFNRLLLSPEGYILEASVANVFWSYEGALYTPSRELPLFYGITLERFMERAKESGVPVKEVKMKLEDLPPEAALYVCNCLMGVVPALIKKG